jgi:glycosyltransferase involved in cell wall biosynthesis
MNIALIMHELLVEGGGERQCVSLARALMEQGQMVTIYTSVYDQSNCFPDICRNLTVKDVGRGWFPWLKKPHFVRGYLDMLHMAAALNSRHEIWNPHHWPAQWGAVRLRRKLGGKVVWMCNDVPNFHEKAQKVSIQAIVRWLQYFYDRSQNRKVDLTLFLSNWAESQFKTIYGGPTRVVRSGSDPDRFAPGGDRAGIRGRFNFDPVDFVLLWLGIFMPHRRLEDAIQAIKLLKLRGVRAKLLLAGSDRSYPEYFKFLQALAKNLDVQDLVIFTGKVADEEIRDFYCACDTFLFPNENQTWGLAVLEAMACGRPVLVSRGAAVHEVLTDQENALLFPARDPEVLAQKIELLANDPQMRQGIAQKGMALARTTYNWTRFAGQIISVCNEVLSGNQPQYGKPPVSLHRPAAN